MDFNNYLHQKQQLNKHFCLTLALLDRLNLRYASDKLKNYQRNLENEKFSVVVIGEFSRGKSTFVNAMLGKTILPSSKQPTTNIISKIIYDEKPSYTLHYKDGRMPKQITDEEFLSIKVQAEVDSSNLEKAKNYFKKTEAFSKIKFAEIAYPLSFCKNGVEVVDTPGTNDLNVGRMEITYEYLQNAEAALLILGADQALSKSEKIFLQDRVLGNQIRDIFIVVNYKDQLSGPEEEERVKQYVLDNLSDVGDFSKRIFLVSSKQALLYRRKENGEELKKKTLLSLPDSIEETGFPNFEMSLARFLSEEKGMAKLRKYVQCCQSALDDIENTLKSRKDATSRSADELRQKLQEQRPKYQKAKEGAENVAQYLRSRLMMQEGNLIQKADVTANRIKQAAAQAIDNYKDGMKTQDVQYLVDKAITPIQKRFIEEVNKLQHQTMQQESKQAIKQLQKIWNDMDFPFESLPISNELALLSDINSGINDSPSFQKSDAYGLLILVGTFALASAIGGLAGGAVMYITSKIAFAGLEHSSIRAEERKEAVRREVRERYDKILKSFSEDVSRQYRKSVDTLCSSMQAEVDNRLETMEQQLRSLIDAKESKERYAATEAQFIEKQFAELKRIRAGLAEVFRV